MIKFAKARQPGGLAVGLVKPFVIEVCIQKYPGARMLSFIVGKSIND